MPSLWPTKRNLYIRSITLFSRILYVAPWQPTVKIPLRCSWSSTTNTQSLRFAAISWAASMTSVFSFIVRAWDGRRAETVPAILRLCLTRVDDRFFKSSCSIFLRIAWFGAISSLIRKTKGRDNKVYAVLLVVLLLFLFFTSSFLDCRCRLDTISSIVVELRSCIILFLLNCGIVSGVFGMYVEKKRCERKVRGERVARAVWWRRGQKGDGSESDNHHYIYTCMYRTIFGICCCRVQGQGCKMVHKDRGTKKVLNALANLTQPLLYSSQCVW